MRMGRMAHVGQLGRILPNLAPQVFRNTACVRWHASHMLEMEDGGDADRCKYRLTAYMEAVCASPQWL